MVQVGEKCCQDWSKDNRGPGCDSDPPVARETQTAANSTLYSVPLANRW